MQPLRNDPELQLLIEQYGELTLEPADNPYKRLVHSIISQQLSTTSATAIRTRLFDQFEIAPETMLAADGQKLQDIGLSRQKIDYIKSAAEQFLEDDLTQERFHEMSNAEAIDELTAIHGIGVWTAKMFLMFVLAREDVFPVEDLGIRNGMQQLYGDLSRSGMVEKAEEWRPYRSIASLYLWKAVEE